MTPDERTIAFSKVCLVLVVIFILGVLGESTNAEDNNRHVRKVTYDPLVSKREEVKNHFLKNEQKVGGAFWDYDSHFVVGLNDDGSRRDGYAMYVCEILYQYGFKGENISVEIIDTLKFAWFEKRVVLGEYQCK